MATRYSALLERSSRADTSEPLFDEALFQDYWDPEPAKMVLAELHQDLSIRGLICEDLLGDIASLQTSRQLEQHLEGLIVKHDLDCPLKTHYTGAVPFVLDDDLQPVYREDFKSTQVIALLDGPGHFTSRP